MTALLQCIVFHGFLVFAPRGGRATFCQKRDMAERDLDPLLPLRVVAVGWLVGLCVGWRGVLNLRTTIPKGALVAEKMMFVK